MLEVVKKNLHNGYCDKAKNLLGVHENPEHYVGKSILFGAN